LNPQLNIIPGSWNDQIKFKKNTGAFVSASTLFSFRIAKNLPGMIENFLYLITIPLPKTLCEK